MRQAIMISVVSIALLACKREAAQVSKSDRCEQVAIAIHKVQVAAVERERQAQGPERIAAALRRAARAAGAKLPYDDQVVPHYDDVPDPEAVANHARTARPGIVAECMRLPDADVRCLADIKWAEVRRGEIDSQVAVCMDKAKFKSVFIAPLRSALFPSSGHPSTP